MVGSYFKFAMYIHSKFPFFLSMVQSIGLDHKVAQVWTSYAAEIDEYLNDGQMMGGKTAS